jgi:ABC-type transport system involved in multi-copper enzyme maturation permease subunit
MLDLVWKDVVAARKLLLLVIPLGGAQLAVLASVPPIYPIAALSFSALLAFGSVALEENQRTELLWNSLPVSRAEVVMARYLTALIGMTIGLALGWALAQVAARPVPTGALGSATFTSLSAHALMFGLLAFSAAVFLPLSFRFGAGRGLVLFSAVSVGTLIVVSLLAQLYLSAKGYPSPLFDPQAWRAAGPRLIAQLAEWLAPRLTRLLALLVGVSIVALGLSCAVAQRLYETRDL